MLFINIPDWWFIQLNMLWMLLSILLEGLKTRRLFFSRWFFSKSTENCYAFECIKIPAYLIYLIKTNQFPVPFSENPTITNTWMLLRTHFTIETLSKKERKLIVWGTNRPSDWDVNEINAQQLLFNVNAIPSFNLVLSWDHAILGEESVRPYFLF